MLAQLKGAVHLGGLGVALGKDLLNLGRALLLLEVERVPKTGADRCVHAEQMRLCSHRQPQTITISVTQKETLRVWTEGACLLTNTTYSGVSANEEFLTTALHSSHRELRKPIQNSLRNQGIWRTALT
jgi:hypothetical protein